MSSYPFLTVAGKWALQRRLERLAQVIGADFSLWRVNRAYPAERYVQHTLGLLDARHQHPEVWRAFLKGHQERLAQLGCHVPECYLAVSLAQHAPSGFGGGLVRASDRLRGRIEQLAGIGTGAPIPAGRLRELAAAEQRVYERLSGVVSLRRAQTVELQWLLRRAECRGLAEPELDAHWQPQAIEIDTDGEVVYEPLESVLWRCANCAISEHERTLQVDGEQGISFQAMLTAGALGDSPQFPGAGAELLFAPLEALGFPIDAVVHTRWLGNREALTQVRKRIADVEHAYREQLTGSAFGPGLQAEEDRALAREYEAKLQAGSHPAMLTGWISLALGAPSEQELDRRVGAVREQYGDVLLHRPAGLQHQLFFDHLPRPDGGVTEDYAQQLTVEQLGAMVATATRAVGSERGPYLGYTPVGARRPVRYDPTQAAREDRPSAVLLVGTLGSGKTVAAQAIAYGAHRRGSLVVDFDPKPDHGWENLPELTEDLQVLELSGDPAQRGRLDPLAIGLDDLREDLACSYLIELLRDPPAAWENAIARAVRDAVRENSHGLLRVVEILCQGQGAAREAGEALEVLSDFGLARLGFGAGDETIVRAARSLITIRMPGLSLPDPLAARDNYTRSERVSVATLTLVAAYALRLIADDRSHHKVVLLGEIWFLLASQQGRAIIDKLVRLGRALNTTVLLETQRTADLGELADLIGYYLVFGQSSPGEAKRALRLIGLDGESPELIRLALEMEEGRCLMRDLDGRIEQVQVDLAPRLLAALETTPSESKGSST
ncbi:MAG: ATP-binding protein [Solirubrobacteraceae bacterium]